MPERERTLVHDPCRRPAKSWKPGVDTTPKTTPAARSDTMCRLPCIIPMASPARHREAAGKLQHPAARRLEAEH